MPHNDSYFEISVVYVHHTDAAVLIEDDGQKIWIPLSTVNTDDLNFDEFTKGDVITIEVKEWMLHKHGLI